MDIQQLTVYSALACVKINTFAKEVLVARGYRIGSGMGMLLEALWGYYVNKEMAGSNFELAWLPEHQYNDFVCLKKEEEWNESTRQGESFRLEVKSMNLGADESKAHFDILQGELAPVDVLLIMVWRWESMDAYHAVPQITDHFIGSAKEVAELRDALHQARGGSFVSNENCQETCDCIDTCRFHGEPLNAAGKRERLSGPESARPSQKVSYAANFGGLIRMLKTNSEEARFVFRRIRRKNDTAHQYISFIHRNFPTEEVNQYTVAEWRTVAQKAGLEMVGSSKTDLIAAVRSSIPGYQELLREC